MVRNEAKAFWLLYKRTWKITEKNKTTYSVENTGDLSNLYFLRQAMEN